MKENFTSPRAKATRIILVGSDREDAIENFFVKYLRREGVETFFFPAYTLFYEYYYSGLWHKLAFRAGLSGIYKQINRQFRKHVEEFQPDLIWVFKGMEIFPGSLEWAKSKGIRLVNYNPDNPFLFTGKGSGNRNITRSLGLYDLHFTYNLDIRKQLEDQIKADTSLIPFGYDIDASVYEQVARQEEIVKVCFLGNPDQQRVSFIKDLASRGIEMDVYGRDWNRWLRHSSIRVFDPVYGVEMWKVLYRYRVQLNLMRIHNTDSHNMRSFEVPAIGGIMLAPDTKEHRIFFEEGKEGFLYKGVIECMRLARKLFELTLSVG